MKLSTVVLALFATVHAQDYYDSYYVGDDNSTDLAPGITVGERGQGGVRSQGNNGGGNGYNNNADNYNNGNNGVNVNANTNYGDNQQPQPQQPQQPQQYEQPQQPQQPVIDETLLQCWHCDQPTLELCESKGMMKACRAPAQGHSSVCMVELRERDGDMFGVCMGCKDEATCINQQKNNFQHPRQPANNQCKPDADQGPSVCRSCCKGFNCWGNAHTSWVLGPQSSIDEWKQDYLN